MIATIGRGVLGLTVQCARCHNHKFDPIPQKDYYKMQASLFGYVETDFPLTSREQAEAYEKKLADIDARIEPLKRRDPPARRALPLEAGSGKIQEIPANVQRAIAIPEDKRTPGETLLANQVIRTTSRVAAARSTAIMPAGGPGAEEEPERADPEDRKGAAEADPDGGGRHRRRLPLYSRRRRRRARAGQRHQARGHRRQLSSSRPGRYQAAALLFSDSRRRRRAAAR